MQNTPRAPKRPPSPQPTQDSEFWQFLDNQTNAAVPPQTAPSNGHASPSVDALLLEYWDQPNETQLNIRLPAAAKRMIERLARRKTVGVSTLVRMWVIESLRREVAHGAPFAASVAFRDH